MNELISYDTIVAAKSGDSIAMDVILKHYAPMITAHSIRPVYDQFGNCFEVIDEDMRQRIEAALVYEIVFRFDPTQLPLDEVIEE